MLLLLIVMVVLVFQDVAYSFPSFVHNPCLGVPKICSRSVTRPGRTSHSEYYAAACNVDTPLSLISNACVCVHSQNRKLGGCLPLLYPLPSFLASRVHNRKGKANRRGKKGQRKKKKKKENNNEHLRQSPSRPRPRHGCCH